MSVATGWPPFEAPAAHRARCTSAWASTTDQATAANAIHRSGMRTFPMTGKRTQPKYGRGHQGVVLRQMQVTPNASTVDANARPSQRRRGPISLSIAWTTGQAPCRPSDIHGLLLRAHLPRRTNTNGDGSPQRVWSAFGARGRGDWRRAEAFFHRMLCRGYACLRNELQDFPNKRGERAPAAAPRSQCQRVFVDGPPRGAAAPAYVPGNETPPMRSRAAHDKEADVGTEHADCDRTYDITVDGAAIPKSRQRAAIPAKPRSQAWSSLAQAARDVNGIRGKIIDRDTQPDQNRKMRK